MPRSKRRRTNTPKTPPYSFSTIMEKIRREIFLGNELYNLIVTHNRSDSNDEAIAKKIETMQKADDNALQDIVAMIKEIRKENPKDADNIKSVYNEYLYNNHSVLHSPIGDDDEIQIYNS